MVALVFAMGCSDEFLEEPIPTDAVPPSVVYASKAGAEAHIAGILRRMRSQWSETGQDAGGLNSMLYARTVKGNDIIQGNTWFNFDYANDNREPTYRRTNFTWEFTYYEIGQLNQFIQGVGESETISEADKPGLLAQARALRAFYYHQLVLEFAPAYSADPTYAAPPIYKEPSVEGNPMSTTTEMYDFILGDLTYAVANAPTTRRDKSFINVDVANAFLARVYQVMGDWVNAEAAANAAYAGQAVVLDSTSYDAGFNSLENDEWIWGMPQYDDQSAYYYSAPHAHADHFVLSYSGTFFNGDFVALFSDTDVRNLFLGGAYPNTTPASFQYWITTKFQFTFDADIPVIRTPEMMLIEAEAKVHNGDPGGAHDLLYALQLNRDPHAVKSANTGAALIDEILVERRKELYAEIGVEWFDARRLGRGITRTGNHRVGDAASLEPNDNKFFLKIPQAEVDANENIDDAVNANR